MTGDSTILRMIRGDSDKPNAPDVRGKVKLARHVMADHQPNDSREALRLMSADLSAEVAPKS